MPNLPGCPDLNDQAKLHRADPGASAPPEPGGLTADLGLPAPTSASNIVPSLDLRGEMRLPAHPPSDASPNNQPIPFEPRPRWGPIGPASYPPVTIGSSPGVHHRAWEVGRLRGARSVHQWKHLA